MSVLAVGAVALAVGATPIEVGGNVQVSAANPNRIHSEVIADVDPDDPGHLIACSHIRGSWPESGRESRSIVYISVDAGQSWSEALVADGSDPFCAFGRHGAAYFTSLAKILYRSTDGGRHWVRAATYAKGDIGIDREYIAVDNGRSKFSGNVYINAAFGGNNYDEASGPSPSGVVLWHSIDGGKTFEEPIFGFSAQGRGIKTMGPGAVMADGTYVVVFQELEQVKSISQDTAASIAPERVLAEEKRGWIKLVRSRDGGDTLEHARVVASTTMSYDPVRGAGVDQGIAIDRESGPFANRLYAVWRATHLNRSRIWFAYSSDGGQRWSEPVTVDDSPARADPQTGPNDFMPAVAVNDQGVLGILWYDRRDNSDDLGWYARFAASLDGGDTFLPSVRVSEAPMSFSGRVSAFSDGTTTAYVSSTIGNHTVGLAAGSDGIFHPVWVDNRSGLSQLWTAPIHVIGAAVRNGAAELSRMRDISSSAPAHMANEHWDLSTGEFDCDLSIKNTSETPVLGPIVLRLLRFESELGPVTGIKIDGRTVQTGAAIHLAPNGLPPEAESKTTHLVARVAVMFGTHDQDAVERFQHVFSLKTATLALEVSRAK